MDIIGWILLIVIGVFFISRVLPAKGITNITVQEAKAKFKDHNVQFIDVRTPGEYKANYRKPFKNIPLSELPKKINMLDKGKKLLLYAKVA